MRNISLWGVWGVCQPLTWTNNQPSACPRARDCICCFDLAFCSLFICVWIGKPTVLSLYKALVQWSVQLKDFYTISVQCSRPSLCIFSHLSHSGLNKAGSELLLDIFGRILLALVRLSCKERQQFVSRFWPWCLTRLLGQGQEIKGTFRSGRSRYFSPCSFLSEVVSLFAFFFFPPPTWLAAKNWSKNEEQELFIWALI